MVRIKILIDLIRPRKRLHNGYDLFSVALLLQLLFS